MINGTSSFSDIPINTVVLPDAGFDSRWTAWVARGQAHERRVRRRVVVLAGALALGAAIVHAVMR
jgi:hypothetical protein